jgi:D-cysteine desulfhydrase/L-cysteate sulfo-lyase
MMRICRGFYFEVRRRFNSRTGTGTEPMQIRELPRFRMAQLPTPLEEAPRLAAALGGPRIFFKRDDLTGAGLGGNKVRKLEFVIGRAMAEGADTLVVCGGFQSNLARIAAAMGNKAGMQVELVLGGVPGERRVLSGNLLLDSLFGANVRLVDTVPRWEFGTTVEDVAAEVRSRGHRPFVMPLGGSSPEGMAGYVYATLELLAQISEKKIAPSHLFVAVGSGGTYAGLVLGAKNLEAPYRVVGISVSRTTAFLRDKVGAEALAACRPLGLEQAPCADELIMHDEYIGAGYGEITEGCREAIALTAKTEGVILDPVYSGKCMHGLIDQVRKGAIGADQSVIFLHTGGWPAIFSYDTQELGLSH